MVSSQKSFERAVSDKAVERLIKKKATCSLRNKLSIPRRREKLNLWEYIVIVCSLTIHYYVPSKILSRLLKLRLTQNFITNIHDKIIHNIKACLPLSLLLFFSPRHLFPIVYTVFSIIRIRETLRTAGLPQVNNNYFYYIRKRHLL